MFLLVLPPPHTSSSVGSRLSTCLEFQQHVLLEVQTRTCQPTIQNYETYTLPTVLWLLSVVLDYGD